MLVLSEEQRAVVRELAECRAATAKLKKRSDDLRAELLQSLQVEEEGIVVGAGGDAIVRGTDSDGRVVVTITPEVRTKINAAKLRALYPDIWEECYTTSIVTVIRTP